MYNTDKLYSSNKYFIHLVQKQKISAQFLKRDHQFFANNDIMFYASKDRYLETELNSLWQFFVITVRNVDGGSDCRV